MSNFNLLELICNFSPLFQKIKAKAIYDNIAETVDELAFRKGDILTVIEQNTDSLEGWWLCTLRGRQVSISSHKNFTKLPEHCRRIKLFIADLQELLHNFWYSKNTEITWKPQKTLKTYGNEFTLLIYANRGLMLFCNFVWKIYNFHKLFVSPKIWAIKFIPKCWQKFWKSPKKSRKFKFNFINCETMADSV